MIKYILPVLLTTVLAACQVERRTNFEYTNTGQELGARGFREIDPSESRVAFAGSDPVKRREAESLSDRYIEQVTFKNNGSLRYSKLFSHGFSSRDTPTDMIQSVLGGVFYKDKGINFDRAKIKNTPRLTYLLQSSQTDNCFVAFAYFGSGFDARQDSPGNQSIYVSMCYKNSSTTAATLEAEMVDILSRARYDEGGGGRSFGGPSGLGPPNVSAPGISAPPPIANGVLDPGSRLKQIDDAFRQNLMSPAEYQTKRKAIIDAM
jgi:hypothetical protein